MDKMIIEKTARAIEIHCIGACIVSTTDCTHFKFAVYFVLHIVLNIKQSNGKVNFDIIFLLNKWNIITITNLKQSKCSERNSNKPEVFVIFSKG